MTVRVSAEDGDQVRLYARAHGLTSEEAAKALLLRGLRALDLDEDQLTRVTGVLQTPSTLLWVSGEEMGLAGEFDLAELLGQQVTIQGRVREGMMFVESARLATASDRPFARPLSDLTRASRGEPTTLGEWIGTAQSDICDDEAVAGLLEQMS